jgi:hypothetical protein
VNTVDDALRALVDRGFRYLRAPGHGTGDTQVDFTLLYVLGWEAPYIDALHVRAEDDATAIRVRSDETNLDLFALGNTVWAHEGGFIETVAALLALPPPDTRGAPTLLRRPPSRLIAPGDGTPRTAETNRPYLPALPIT